MSTPSRIGHPVPNVLSAAHGSVDRKTVDEVLWWIHEALSAEAGEGFFRTFIETLCKVYGVKYAFVTRCMDQPPTRVRTLAYWSEDHLRDNKEFALDGFPCKETIHGREAQWIPSALAERYPSKKGWAEGYCGAPLFGADQRTVVGHIAFFTHGPMARNMFDDPLFHVFIARCNAELRRLVAEEDARDRQRQMTHAGRLVELGEMASTIAHELAQPLTAIAMNARTGLRIAAQAARPGSVDDSTAAFRMIEGQAERAVALLKSIRGFARQEDAAPAACDVNEIVNAAADLAELDARRASVTIRRELGAGIPPVPVIRLEIEQVVLNLARNAIEALADSDFWPREILLRTRPAADGGVQVAVIDNGAGFAPGILPRLFEPFLTSKPDGLGIGLPLCKSIVERHGGRLTAVPGPGRGAEFSFDLPAGFPG